MPPFLVAFDVVLLPFFFVALELCLLYDRVLDDLPNKAAFPALPEDSFLLPEDDTGDFVSSSFLTGMREIASSIVGLFVTEEATKSVAGEGAMLILLPPKPNVGSYSSSSKSTASVGLPVLCGRGITGASVTGESVVGTAEVGVFDTGLAVVGALDIGLAVVGGLDTGLDVVGSSVATTSSVSSEVVGR